MKGRWARLGDGDAEATSGAGADPASDWSGDGDEGRDHGGGAKQRVGEAEDWEHEAWVSGKAAAGGGAGGGRQAEAHGPAGEGWAGLCSAGAGGLLQGGGGGAAGEAAGELGHDTGEADTAVGEAAGEAAGEVAAREAAVQSRGWGDGDAPSRDEGRQTDAATMAGGRGGVTGGNEAWATGDDSDGVDGGGVGRGWAHGDGGAAGPERAGRQRGTGAAGSLWGSWPGWGRTGPDRVEEGTGPSRTARKGGEAEASSRTGPGGPGGAKEMAGGGREGGAWGIPGAALSLGRRLLDALPDD